MLEKARQAEETGDSTQAIQLYSNAVRQNPQDFDLRFRLAELYFKESLYLEAATHFLALSQMPVENETVRKRMAFLQLEFGELKGAEKLLSEELQRNPGSLWAREMITRLLTRQGRLSEAIAAFESLIADPQLAGEDRLRVQVEYGRILFTAKQTDAALGQFNGVLAANPDHYEAQLLRANYYFAIGDKENARRGYLALRESFPKEDEPAIGLAAMAVQENRIDEAVSLYQTANQINPGKVDTLFWLAELHFQKNDAEALQSLLANSAVKTRDRELIALYVRGLQKYMRQDFKGALADFERLQPAMPDYSGMLTKMGNAYLQTGEPAKAEAALSRVPQESLISREQIWSALGRGYLSRTNYTRALNFLKISPEDQHIGPLTRAYYGLSDYNESLKSSQKWMTQEPESTLAILLAAESAQRLNREGLSRQYLSRLAQLEPNTLAGIYAQAQLFLMDKQLESALQLILKHYPQMENQAGPNLLLGQIYHAIKRYDEAAVYASKALAIDPNLYQAEGLLGLLALENKNPREARSAFERAIKLNPGERSAHYGLGLMEYQSGNYSQAIPHLEHLFKTVTNSLDVAVMLASSDVNLNLNGNPRRALEAAQRAWMLSPTNTYAAYLTARACIMNGQANAAAAALQHGRTLDKDYAPFHYAESLLHIFKRNIDQAIKAAQAGAAMHPKDWLLRSLELDLLRRAKRYPEAEMAVARLKTDFPEMPDVFVIEGDLLAALNRFDAARAAYLKALKIAPAFVKAQQGLLETYFQENRPAEAAELMEQVLADNPGNNLLRFACASIREMRKDYKEAEKHYREILKTEPQNVPTLNNLAMLISRDQARLKEAFQMAMAAFAQDRRNPIVMDTLGMLYLKTNDLKQAMLLLQDAHRLSPDNPEILFHLAQAQTMSSDWPAARSSVERLLKEFPQFPQLAAVRELQSTINGRLNQLN